MELDFKYLLLKHKEGARYIFESACEKTFKKEFENSFAVECNPGDEGIDIFVGNFDEPIIVYQCKFFIYSIGESQRKQIRDSFKTAYESKAYELKEWNLCVPKALNIDEHRWWATWKKKTTKKYNIKIELLDSTSLLGFLRKHKVDEEVFGLEDSRLIADIHKYLIERENTIKEVLSKPTEIDYRNSVFISKLNSANIKEHHINYERQFFNAEILEKTLLSKGIEKDINELSSLKLNVHDLWLTQYTKHADKEDGNNLLGNVNERIEDLNESALKTSLNISVLEKKGILHQFADNCEIGWVKNYKEKLITYTKNKDGNQG
ncbi:MAG: hypothetical protein JXR82_13590 [Marinifilaceae bacterium]|nr:hypothetical protein [Marinifilaceae bacterium]